MRLAHKKEIAVWILVLFHILIHFLVGFGSDHNLFLVNLQVVRTVASGGNFYRLPPDKENTSCRETLVGKTPHVAKNICLSKDVENHVHVPTDQPLTTSTAGTLCCIHVRIAYKSKMTTFYHLL